MDDKQLAKLKEPFPIELISWRVGALTKDKSKAIPLAYIDARDVMERLDEVCGQGNWQDRYPFKGCCEIGIKIGDEWVWKSNGAGETQVEADKGQYSDSFKRAAVLWGIGRYLYDVPNIWVEVDQYRKIKNPNDKRLKEALEAAAKGIRLPNEPEPEKPKPTPEQQKAIDYIDSVKKEIAEAPQAEDVSAVIHKHLKEIHTFSEAQQKHINDFAANQRNEKLQQPQKEQPMNTQAPLEAAG